MNIFTINVVIKCERIYWKSTLPDGLAIARCDLVDPAWMYTWFGHDLGYDNIWTTRQTDGLVGEFRRVEQ